MSQRFDPFRMDLIRKQDKEKKDFYLGQVKTPMFLDFQGGVLFRAFTDTADEEELNIESVNDISYVNEYRLTPDKTRNVNRLHVALTPIQNNGNYLAVVKSNSLEPIYLGDGYLFFLFCSKPGMEQLQIVKYVSDYSR